MDNISGWAIKIRKGYYFSNSVFLLNAIYHHSFSESINLTILENKLLKSNSPSLIAREITQFIKPGKPFHYSTPFVSLEIQKICYVLFATICYNTFGLVYHFIKE